MAPLVRLLTSAIFTVNYLNNKFYNIDPGGR